MADLLIKHLKQKTEEHSALRSLYSQWDFDEKLIPKALQTVGVLFSHYSRHDESHSKQILVNIERILGANISLLSATDTWLILEAAYWHDIGMVVPQADMSEALKDPGFDMFLHSYCSQPHHELHLVAVAVRKRRGTNAVFDEANPIEMVTRFKELMAEWFRQKHPARADQIVKTPMQSIGVNSPRTELIPSRLFRVLGKICLMHGVTFDALMNDDNGLPYREAGLAQDDCHPRFVACMLRMGDLLDMDDNRFCPVMQRIAGDDRPSLSMAHEDKHSSIRHLRIDQEKIEVSAECETVEGYLEAFKWFEWLKKEMHDQMANWRDIVPDRALGLLPTLGKISLSIGGNLQILRDGERPAFGLDIHNAIELLQGNNLYDSKFACIREALQNAVDATHLRIWLENQNDQSLDWRTPFSSGVASIFKSLPIRFELAELETISESDHDLTSWQVTITDAGTGISKIDLEYMLKIGGSKRNFHRQAKIESMPEWLKPSGMFGIGLQSLFMLTDKIHIETKSILTNEAFQITMHSPTGNKQGLVTLSSADNGFSVPFGTKLRFVIELQKFTRSYDPSLIGTESLAAKFIQKLDPILDDAFPYEAAKVYDAALMFNENSLLPINGEFKTKITEYSSELAIAEDQSCEDKWRFIATDEFECRFWYKPVLNSHPGHALNTFYRGQEFETKGLFFPNVQIAVDILSGSASSWLKFSRDKVSRKALERLNQMILDALKICIKEDLLACQSVTAPIHHVDAATYSIFLKSMGLNFGGDWVTLGEGRGDSWLDVPVINSNKKLRDYFEREEWSVQLTHESNVTQGEGNHLKLEGPNADLTVMTMIREWESDSQRTISVQGSRRIYDPEDARPDETVHERAIRRLKEEDALRNIIVFRREVQTPWDKPALANALARSASSTWGNQRKYLTAKGVANGSVDFQALALRNDVRLRAEPLFPLSLADSDRVVLPFLFLHARTNDGETASVDSLDELCRWVQPNLIKYSDLASIRKHYLDLINYIDNDVMRDTIYWDSWRECRKI
ncbi:hypothetical protein [Pseudomonas sp. PDM27]|uniref:HD domain-containing protein n=1 Tax=Pseudomonas sp. PDM27 TaxID=2854769 RepID=UPI001C466CBB|nr:hypothetical protein [Pseudomonas sp. PDM27]MBV7569645.1 hypothetical protein [Pseudomonas sp. PDM27]